MVIPNRITRVINNFTSIKPFHMHLYLMESITKAFVRSLSSDACSRVWLMMIAKNLEETTGDAQDL